MRERGAGKKEEGGERQGERGESKSQAFFLGR